MKTFLNLLYFVAALISIVFNGSCINRETTYSDDRICKHPYLDCILEVMISDCKHRSDLNRNPEFDTTAYYVTFDFFSMNDTDKVWVMGKYEEPFIFHDKKGFNVNHYIGYFKRNNVYCYIYESTFASQFQGKMKKSPITNVLIRDWALKNHPENPKFIPDCMIDLTQDPYIFEYMIDTLGNCTLLRKGHW